MTFFITGLSGFLGSRLALSWTAKGHKVCGSVRNAATTVLEGMEVIEFDLRKGAKGICLSGVDTLIHAAYDFDAGVDVNVRGTRELFQIASGAGARRQIFVSSYSARPDSMTDYGRAKFLIESFFLDQGHTVVRPGLVIGNGGLFRRNVARILSAPLIPLLDGGRDLLPVIGIDDFVSAVTAIAASGGGGAYNLFYPRLIPMRDLVGLVNRYGGHRSLCLPVPASAAAFCLDQLRRAGIRTHVSSGNIKALKQNQNPIHKSDLHEILPDPLTPEKAVEEAVRAFRASPAESRLACGPEGGGMRS
jgi:NADH dehydrogenase